MKLDYRSKALDYDDSGAAKHTRVILGNSEGAFYPVFLAPDKINLSNTELLNLALEQIYQDNFPARAETEKFNELDSKIAEYDTQIKNAVAEARKATEENRQTVNAAVAELTDLVMTLMSNVSFDAENGSGVIGD
ncbi:DUF1366 domain-containing protein [Streptococcus sp. H49]|uniref:DUF1366 domain-containing protein n=1 Tax=Streptococcus huangxiaojuni TaxID=3237239 RepID=UPI0034A2F151